MRKRHRVVVALLATSLGAGALATASAGAQTTEKIKNIKIISLFQAKGEATTAIPDFADGAALAVENQKKKGVTVDYERINTPLTASGAQAGLLQAYDKKPDAIVGLPSSQQVIPLGPTIVQRGIPLIALTSTPAAINGAASGGPNLFQIRPLGTGVADANLDYAVKNLKAKRIFLYCLAEALGTEGCGRIKEQVAAKYPKVKIVGEVSGTSTSSDLTQQVLAAKDADPDAIIEFNFPGPLAVFSNQLMDNGVDVPVLDGGSAALAVTGGSLTPEALKNLHGINDCTPTIDQRSVAKKFVSQFKKKYGYDPGNFAAQAYDAVNLMVASAERAGSTDPAAITDALSKISVEGACSPMYKADKRNLLSFSADLVGWDANGKVKALKKVDLPFIAPETTTTTTAAPSR